MVSVLLTLIQFLSILAWIIILSAVFSWLVAFNLVNTNNRAVIAIWDVLNRITAPLLVPIRRILPHIGGIDISPIIGLLLIWFLQDFIARYIIPAVARAGW